jgi:hypothetical protein
LSDFNDQQRIAWSNFISAHFDRAREGRPDELEFDGPREQFFNLTKVDLADDAQRADISWTGFPRNVTVTSISDLQRWRRAEASRDLQDEYCEWSVTRDPDSNKITRVTFTCEGPEYWRFLAETTPQVALNLYRTLISPDVQLEHLFSSNGRYNPRNRWNSTTTEGAMHLIQVNNTLSAEIELAGGSSVVRLIGGRLLTGERELIECGKYGGKERHSDPKIGAVVNSLTRMKADITLDNPVGLYFNDLETNGWETPDGSDPKSYWQYVRGAEGRFVRAVYEVPADRGFVVGDIEIQGRLIEFGAQIADFVTIKLTGVATRVGQSTVEPMQGCRRPRPTPPALEAAPPAWTVEEVLDDERRSAR